MKKIALLSFVFSLFASVAMAQAGFGEIENIVTQGSNSGQATLGVILKWAFAVVLPLITIIGSAIYGFVQTKQKMEQSQGGSAWKLAVTSVGYGILGGFAFFLVGSLISLVLFGDFAKVGEIITNFYLGAVV